jgi:ribosome-associated translation inhibitor RaiA
MVLRRIKRKARALRGKVFSKLGYVPANITISGLKAGEQVFKESILEECRSALRKIRKRVEASELKVHVKSSKRGKGRRFEVKATVVLVRGKLHASASGRELYSALTRVLYELVHASQHAKK